MIARRSVIRPLPLALALSVCCGVLQAAPGVGDVLGRMPFTDEHVSDVLQGAVVTTGVHPMSDREIAVGLACLLNAKAAGQDVESIAAGMWESPRRRVTSSGEIFGGDVERAFAPLRFPAGSTQEIARYLDAGPSETLNLSAAEIARFQALRAGGAAASNTSEMEAAVRESLAHRYQTYRSDGVEGIAEGFVAGRPCVVVLTSFPPEALRRRLPTRILGLSVIVRRTRALRCCSPDTTA